MVNTNIQGPIPLEGAGFIAKRNGNFQPGEFKRLTNVECHDGMLVNRRSVKSVAGSSAGTTVNPMTNCLGFMGHFDTYSILASSTEQVAIGPGEKFTMWAPTLLTVPAEAGSFHRIIGYFRYVKRNYWITLEYRAGIHIKIKLFHGNASADNDVPETYNNAYFATLTETTIYTLLPTDVSFNDFKFNNFILQGNRLWLFTSLGVYFSKATDPTIFTVPDGGFFKFPDQIINHGCSLRDAIYVLCDNTIHTITYSTDPNVDSFVTQISDNMGGEDSAVHKDAVYVINQVGIYRILNGSIDKVIDNEFDVGLDYYHNTITSFEDYLVVNKHSPINYEKFNSGNVQTRTNLFPNPSVETNLTGFDPSTSYMTRERVDLNPAVGGFSPFSGSDFVVKCTKVNNTLATLYTNLYKNPSFEVDASAHTAGSAATISSIAFGGAPDGARALEAVITINRNASNPNNIVSKTIWESDFYPATVDECLYFNFSERRNVDMDDNDGTMYVRLHAYDAAFNQINGADGNTYQLEKAMSNTNNTWHRNWIKYKLDDSVVAGLANVAHVKLKFILKTKQVVDEVFPHYWDKISYFKVDQATFDAIVAPDYIPYFDGNTVDVPNVALYSWTATPGKSSSIQQGDPGTDEQQRLLLSYTSTNILVSPFKSYMLGVAIASPQSNRFFEARVTQYDAGNNPLSTSTFTLESTLDVTQWHYGTIAFFTTANVNYVKIDYLSSDPMDVLEFVYLDAFIVELVSTYTGYFDGSFTDTSAVNYGWSGIAHASPSTAIISNLLRGLYLQGRFFDQGQAFNSLGYNTYFLNMDNGSVHVMDFRDALNLTDANRGRVAEIYVNPNKDSSGNYNLFMYTARETAETEAGYTFTNKFYYMSSFRDISFIDWAVTSGDVLQKYPPKVEIEIDSFTPDGSEYLVKKFRHLLMMGKLPLTDFKVKFGYDNQDYTDEVTLSFDNVVSRPHSPYRIAVNQRCKSLSIFLFNDNFEVPVAMSTYYDVLEISDLRTLWSYSGRAIDRSRLDSV